MITPCPGCGTLIRLELSVTGSPVLLDPVPRPGGRWQVKDGHASRAVFTGIATGRYSNHVLTCPTRAQAEVIFAKARELLA